MTAGGHADSRLKTRQWFIHPTPNHADSRFKTHQWFIHPTPEAAKFFTSTCKQRSKKPAPLILRAQNLQLCTPKRTHSIESASKHSDACQTMWRMSSFRNPQQTVGSSVRPDEAIVAIVHLHVVDVSVGSGIRSNESSNPAPFGAKADVMSKSSQSSREVATL
jgi:hypothetical protein